MSQSIKLYVLNIRVSKTFMQSIESIETKLLNLKSLKLFIETNNLIRDGQKTSNYQI